MKKSYKRGPRNGGIPPEGFQETPDSPVVLETVEIVTIVTETAQPEPAPVTETAVEETTSAPVETVTSESVIPAEEPAETTPVQGKKKR
jgi:hypothetical protein